MNLASWRTWMRPGMLIKRWVLLFLISMTLCSLAIAMGLAWAYRTIDFPSSLTGFVQTITLQFIAHPYREVVLLGGGVGVLWFSVWKLGRAVLGPLMALSTTDRGLAQIVADHRFGPAPAEMNVVTIGGGTGLSNLLRGLKLENLNLTAIVTVADDGGSTGRIRSEFDIPAPGDIRNCITALADDESLVNQLFQYRFKADGSSLNGHSFGNLFITALAQVTGSFERAVIESAKVLAIRGRVLPSTLENVDLYAELIDGTVIQGESSIANKTAPIKRVFLGPESPPGYQPALGAILNADLIILGPGSLYTSVLPNLMVAGVTESIRWSGGTVVYVCNVATQAGETDHFGAADHVRAVVDHVGEHVVDYVLINSNPASIAAIGPELAVEPVVPEDLHRIARDIKVVTRDVVSDRNPLRHDPLKLTAALLEIARGGVAGETSSSEKGKWPPDFGLPLKEATSVPAASAARGTLVSFGSTRE